MTLIKTISVLCLALWPLSSSYSKAPRGTQPTIPVQQINPWYTSAQMRLQKIDKLARIPPAPRGAAKNIILFVGDGMGVSTVTAARILDGQNKGMQGEENQLSFEQFLHTGLAKTYNVDAQTPDSAGTMTALVTGVKTNIGVLGLAEGVQRGNCNSKTDQSLISTLELAEMAGLSTGIVTTARVTHATPAATYAESVDRNWESDKNMPNSAIKNGCKDIAFQLINFAANLNKQVKRDNINGIEVVFGGGKRNFIARRDGQNLINNWLKLHPDGQYIANKKEFDALNPKSTSKVLGLFNDSHMKFSSEQTRDEPSLSEMTQKAIQTLKANPKGFFLMVEGARIDHAHHSVNAYNALNETIELSKAVQSAQASTNSDDTLIIVTADHSHVFTIAGYPKRGNPILGEVIGVGENQVAKADNGKPYTTLGYTNGPTFYDINMSTTSPKYRQKAGIPLSSETHGAEDVSIYATGPGAHLVTGTMEQNQIFHIMEYAGDLLNKAKNGF